MRRIVFVVHNLGVGGAQKVLVEVANLASSIGFDVQVLSLSNIECVQKTEDNIRVTQLDYQFYKNILLKLKEKSRILVAMREYWKISKPDAVVVFGLDATMLVQMSMPKGVRILSSERNAPEAYNMLYRKISIKIYKQCDMVVFQMDQVKNFYSKYLNSVKCCVIPNAYRERSVERFVGERRKVISSAAARFDHRKGIDTLIKAFAIVHKHHPEYQLIIYGDGDLRSSYENIISTLGIDSCVKLPGRTTNVQKAIREDMVFVLPSRHEGIPNVLLEAMGIGLACVACDCVPGGVKNVSDNGRRAALVKVDDEIEMANKILKIISDREYRTKLEISAMEVRNVYSQNKINSMWENALNMLFK